MAAFKISIITFLAVFVIVFGHWITGGNFERGPGMAGVYILSVYIGFVALMFSYMAYKDK